MTWLLGHRGQFCNGFICRLDGGDCSTAELWACLVGLKSAWEAGFRRIILESDSADTSELLLRAPNPEHHGYVLVMEIQSIRGRDWKVQVQHVRHEGNTAADFLAKEHLDLAASLGFHAIMHQPDELRRLTDLDWPDKACMGSVR